MLYFFTRKLGTIFFTLAFLCIFSCQKSIKSIGQPVGDTTTTQPPNFKPVMHPIAIPDITPNIILILGDDVGYEVPTVNGGESYATPNLDMMARNGMRFIQCHATPLCSPSRFELLT